MAADKQARDPGADGGSVRRGQDLVSTAMIPPGVATPPPLPDDLEQADAAGARLLGEFATVRAQLEAEVADATRRLGIQRDHAAAAGAVIEGLRAELAGYREVFELGFTRMVEAAERWRAEDPAARALVMPDLGDLLAWLMADADRLRAHSVTLNTIGYAIAEALGKVTGGADYMGSPEADAHQLIAEDIGLRTQVGLLEVALADWERAYPIRRGLGRDNADTTRGDHR